jgi:hypothetical protein
MTGSKPMTMEEQAHKYILQKERMKETNRLWRLSHKDDMKETTRLWRLSHKDDMKEKMKTYYQLNKERLNKRSTELARMKNLLLKEQKNSLPLGENPVL